MISQPPSSQAYLSPEQPTSTDAVFSNVSFFLVAPQPKSCLGRLFLTVLGHLQTDTRPVEPSTNDQAVVEAATYIKPNKNERRISMTTAGFEAAVPAIERSQTYTLDRVATGINGVTVH